MRALSITRAQAIGHMDLLWMTVQDQRGPDEDGVMRGWTHDDIANAAEWFGDSKLFVEATTAAGFIDLDGTTYSIHDYIDWMPLHIKERIRKRKAYQLSDFHKTSWKSPGDFPEVSGKIPEVSRKKPETSTPHVHVHEHVHVQKKDSSASPKAKRSEKQVDRDELWEAVVAEWKLPVTTRAQQSRVGQLVTEFKGAGATPAEVPVRRKRVLDAWGVGKDTPESVAKHWGEFDGSNPGPSRVGRIEAPAGKYDGVMAKAAALGQKDGRGNGGHRELAFPPPGQESGH